MRAVTESWPLEPSPAQRAELLAAAGAMVEEFLHGLATAPMVDVDGAAEAAARVREPLPEAGAPLAEVLETVGLMAQKAVNTAGPGFFAYIPGGGLYASAVAEFLAASFNRYVSMAGVAPVAAEVEATVVRWLCDVFDYPAEARGVLTSGGSMANFSAVVAARKAHLGDDLSRGVVYVSAQAHASCAKAGYLAGIPASRIRLVPTDDRLRMDADALGWLIEADREAGLQPFLVMASAGTTNTGAVDPIGAVVDVGQRHGLWVHVDAAYGGPFRLTEHGRRLFAGIEAADSITLDPHKALFLPYGTGALLVRDGRLLREAHHVAADYLQDLDSSDEGTPNAAEYSMELTRGFRGLRLWLPLKLHGAAAFRAALEEKLELARLAHEELAAAPGFEVPLEPELTVVSFRYLPEHGDADAFNQALLRRVNASRRVFLSSTRIDGAFVLRVCVVSHRSHREHVEDAVRVIRAAAAELVSEV